MIEKIGFLTVNYDEPNADSSFRGLTLEIGNEKIEFNSKDPIVDFFEYNKWLANNSDKVFMVTYSSSIDHFYMDSEKYYEKYVVFNKNYSEGNILSYKKLQELRLSHKTDELIKVCVDDSISTWSELKNYVNSKK